MEQSWWWKYWEALFYFAFAGFAGSIGHIMRSLNSNKTPMMSRVLVEGMGAACAGFLVYQVCLAMELSRQWTGAMVGICGWLGSTATIAMLEPVVRRIFGVKDNADQ